MYGFNWLDARSLNKASVALNLFQSMGLPIIETCLLDSGGGGVLDISLDGEGRCLRQISLIFLPCLRQNSDF